VNRLSPGISLSTIFLLAISVSSSAQTQDTESDTFHIRNSSFILPKPWPKGKYTHSMGVQYVIVPKDWSLDNIQAPMFNYNGKYTLPKGFNVQATLSTILVSNRLSAGPFWNYSFSDRIHMGVGYQVAFNYGRLKEFGFNTVLTGWEQQPSLTLGYSFEKTVVTVRGDLYYTTALYLEEGGNVIPFTNGGMNGYSITTTLEQRLWKNRLMTFGVKLAMLRYHILAWPAFPVNKYRYLVPEFQIGLKLGKKS
jgi:hypothetical protein